MKYVLILAVGLITIFSLAVAGARAIGTQDKPSVVAILDSGDCPQPCWQGIQPGKTTLREARTLVASGSMWGAASYDSNGRLTWEMASPGGWRSIATGSRYSSRSTIQTIELIPPRGAVKLGDIVTNFDNPLRMRYCDRNRTPDHIHLFFDGSVEVIAINTEGNAIDRLDPDLLIRSIRYHSPGTANSYNAVDWEGFVSKENVETC